MNSRELRVIEIGRGLTEWVDDRAQERGVPVDSVIRTSTRYPVPYMRPDNPPDNRPIVVAIAGHNPVTLRQIIAAILIMLAILVNYGVGENGGHEGWLPKAPTSKPAMVGSR